MGNDMFRTLKNTVNVTDNTKAFNDCNTKCIEKCEKLHPISRHVTKVEKKRTPLSKTHTTPAYEVIIGGKRKTLKYKKKYK